jgi:membrane-bound serine protease (ClpP class)
MARNQSGTSLVRADRRGQSRQLLGIFFLLAAALAALAAGLASTTARAAGSRIDVVQFASDVNPAAAQFVGGAIDSAQSDGAAAVVVEIDTFGGDLASMQSIREKELGSKVPIIVYVSPAGAHADSAGALISLAAPIVAMAPGTRIGAASPVDVSGADLSATEKAKVTNALVAQVTSDQTAFGRNVSDATAMVTAAEAFDAQNAVTDHVVNLQADTLSDLLAQVDGESVKLGNGTTMTLAVSGVPIQEVKPSPRDQLFGLLLDPNVLLVLFVVAAVCLYLEISHPGAIVPGTVGGIALLLFLLGAGSLSPNWAGLALMVLALVLLVIDVRVPTHGVLTVGALISLVVGTLLFFNSGPSDQAVSPYLVFGLAAGVGVIAAIVLRYAIASRRAKVDTGGDRLIGQVATAVTPLAPDGRVRVLGEDWSATLESPPVGGLAQRVEIGGRVRIVGVEGLRLRVRPEPSTP